MRNKLISGKWSQLALSMLGDKNGRHCHWCQFIHCEDSTAECFNEASPFCDGDRIRTWDGLECASKCKVFELDDWYTEDKNYEEYFGEVNDER